MIANTVHDDLTINMGLKYRSMRHVTLGVTIMMVTLIVGTIEGSVTGVFVTCSLGGNLSFD